MSTFFEKQFDDSVSESKFQSFQQIYRLGRTSTIKYWMYGILALLIIILFLPWTQNIRAKGAVTTLRQEQRPQELNTIIGGRVIKWYVKEGDNVKKGDTILQLGEVKVDYFDPKLLQRTQQQINAKQQSMQGYAGKAQTAGLQVAALTEGQALKLSSLDNKIKQQRLKIESDSIDLQAVKTEVAVAQRQIEAAQQMWDAGVISLIDFERRKVTFQNVTAKRISVENKFLQGKQELINLYIEKNSTIQEYTDKISKAQGDKFSALSDAASTEADVSKLENVYASYDIRNQLYYVTAPQDGQVIQAKKAGIGEIVKEGEMVVEIVPREIQYAVEMFVEPLDLPLISIGQKVRFVFDGFPAIVFSGWPQASYGTFGGKVVAIETSVSSNGKFRALVAEDPAEKPWPKQLRMGAASSSIALLKDVQVWYELWRNINGFPPDYYKIDEAKDAKSKKK
ncbi:MAG: HlyD family efflux transporter periplasmic adaptor subunit [Bacteroidetes bacterium]|nr:MAG: HlyD family efflux transporter periplasmic adaptor subunit [Bacteroidota bacterium]TAF94242.1 MAG: HlyD family efflux transporter periplasmic adaptor subunit [Bacteroidota bacterium]